MNLKDFEPTDSLCTNCSLAQKMKQVSHVTASREMITFTTYRCGFSNTEIPFIPDTFDDDEETQLLPNVMECNQFLDKAVYGERIKVNEIQPQDSKVCLLDYSYNNVTEVEPEFFELKNQSAITSPFLVNGSAVWQALHQDDKDFFNNQLRTKQNFKYHRFLSATFNWFPDMGGAKPIAQSVIGFFWDVENYVLLMNSDTDNTKIQLHRVTNGTAKTVRNYDESEFANRIFKLSIDQTRRKAHLYKADPTKGNAWEQIGEDEDLGNASQFPYQNPVFIFGINDAADRQSGNNHALLDFNVFNGNPSSYDC